LQSLQKQLIANEKYWDSQLEELEKRDDLTAEFKGYLAAGYLEQKAKWCAPYRRALAELKKMKT